MDLFQTHTNDTNSSNDESNHSEHFFSLSSSDDDVGSSDCSFKSIPLPLSGSLENCFAQSPKNFNVVHINAQSLPAHYPDLLASFDVKDIHAILISESFLKPCLTSSFYPLPGFHLIRNDRTGKGGGGVAIYLRSHIPFNILSKSPSEYSTSAEHLFLEITLCHVKVLLGVFYSPNLNINYFASLETLLENFIPTYDHSIILGDFNTCLLKNNHRSRKLISVIEAANLHILPSNSTHHFPNCEPSLLDLSIVSSVEHVYSHGQLPADAFSYHDLIYISYKVRPPKPKPRVLMLRNFKDMNVDNLLDDANALNWTAIYEADTVDQKVALFNSFLTVLYDQHAPVRAIRVKHLPAPWLTPKLREFMAKKAAAKLEYRQDASNTAKRDNFVHIRNRCNTACRDARRHHIHASVENGDSSKVWRFLRTLGIGKSRQDSPSDVNIDGLNAHFTASNSDFDISACKKNALCSLSITPIYSFDSFSLQPVNEADVRKNINAISSSAVGSDDISRAMITPVLDCILPIITHILNFSLNSQIFPEAWKHALVTPLPKNSNPTSFSHYRPISILPFLSKVLERLVHRQLSYFLGQNNLLNPLQSGFRPGHSTVTALTKVTDDIRLGMESQRVTLLTLLDFSNAFNTVDFDILLAILRSLNVSSSAVSWFGSYLTGRRQRVKAENRLSNWADITSGVPQGGVLSPLLFSLFINSITNSLSSSYHLYADDLQLYTQESVENLSAAIDLMNDDLQSVATWSAAHGLSVNPTKSQCIIIGSSRQTAKLNIGALRPVSFKGVQIPFCDCVKNLGVYFDRTLSWSKQVGEVSRKTFASFMSLKRLSNFLPFATKIVLAQSLLLPILDYADVCYLDLTEEYLDKLERLQNMGIRFVFGLRKYDHVSEFRKKLKWLPIRLRRNMHILCMVYKALYDPLAPTYLKELYKFRQPVLDREPRSCNTFLLEFPPHRTGFYGGSFAVQGVRLWNSLPLPLRQSKSFPTFKSSLMNHFASACGY